MLICSFSDTMLLCHRHFASTALHLPLSPAFSMDRCAKLTNCQCDGCVQCNESNRVVCALPFRQFPRHFYFHSGDTPSDIWRPPSCPGVQRIFSSFALSRNGCNYSTYCSEIHPVTNTLKLSFLDNLVRSKVVRSFQM